MSSLVSSFLIVLLAEIADKTMLLTLGLSAKLRKIQLIFGIFLASLVVMLIPVALGDWLNKIVPKSNLILASALIFILIGILTLVGREEDEEKEKTFKLPDFLKAFLIFFLAETGDKTQIATFSLSMTYENPALVWVGASFGMFLPNLIIVLVGYQLVKRIPLKYAKYLTGGIFIAIGVFVLIEHFGI